MQNTFILKDDELRLWEWRQIDDGVFQFDQQVVFTNGTTINEESIIVNDNSITLYDSEGIEYNMLLTDMGEYILCVISTPLRPNSITFKLFNLDGDSGNSCKLPNPKKLWDIVKKVIEIIDLARDVWDMVPEKCQDMYQQGLSCAHKGVGCTPIYDFQNCELRGCKKFIGTPQETNC